MDSWQLYIQKRFITNIHFPDNNAQTLHQHSKVEGIDFLVTTDRQLRLYKLSAQLFSTRESSSGIGLSLCKQIMRVHNGNITVQSKENEGTAFYLQL
ncbi:MAG TPA: ATP-binding protein [Prolixibacteraceae bacterium]|jgi:light-regulated signal transduction histidine kinase (bacteriophytochrome)